LFRPARAGRKRSSPSRKEIGPSLAGRKARSLVSLRGKATEVFYCAERKKVDWGGWEGRKALCFAKERDH